MTAQSQKGHPSQQAVSSDGPPEPAAATADRVRWAALCRRYAIGGGLIIIAINVLALIGGLTDHWELAGEIRQRGAAVAVPVAPSAAVMLLLLSTAILSHTCVRGARLGRAYVLAGAALVTLWGLLGVGELATERRLWLEEYLIGQQGNIGNAPRGYMAPVSAMSFVLVGLTLFALPRNRTRRLYVALSALPLAVIAVNIWVLWTYMRFYSELARSPGVTLEQLSGLYMILESIPVAAPSAISFVVISVAVILAEGPGHFLFRPLLGCSTRAWLLRSFLPPAVAVVLVSTILGSMLTFTDWFDGPVVLLTLWTLAAPVVVALLLSKIAFHLGGALDRAEADRTRALEDARHARDAAEAANLAKNRFIANMNHELRTPLNAVIGYSELLQEEVQELGQQDLLPDLCKINAAGKHLLALINDILDLAKIEAGKVELCLERFELAPMIDDATTTIRPLVEKNGNRLEVLTAAELGAMDTDITRLRQCLFNLLSNAGKFTQNGTVILDVSRATVDGGDWVTFRVSDTGIGLSEEQIDSKLFQPFSQADASTTRKYGGTGLGLSITQKLVQMMGGRISVTSVLGKGSTFSLHMPAIAPRPAPRQPRPALETVVIPPGKRTITMSDRQKAAATVDRNSVLVVDDDPAAREMIERFLTAEGYRVVTLARGEDVLRLARELRPQAITLDVMMPGMDGWSVLSALKTDPELAGIPVVMLTIVEDRNLGYALGATDYLTKPIDRDAMLRALRRSNVATSGRRALVVEDDADTRDMLQRMLEKDGWTVIEAGSGRQALNCLADAVEQRPTLILLDLMMPDVDGFEFLTEMRQHPEWQSIPVIVVTAKDLTQEDRMFLNGSLLLAGCVRRVLQKGSFTREDLLREVRTLVNPRL